MKSVLSPSQGYHALQSVATAVATDQSLAISLVVLALLNLGMVALQVHYRSLSGLDFPLFLTATSYITASRTVTRSQLESHLTAADVLRRCPGLRVSRLQAKTRKECVSWDLYAEDQLIAKEVSRRQLTILRGMYELAGCSMPVIEFLD